MAKQKTYSYVDATYLKALRKKNRLTQKQLGDMLGNTRAIINIWEGKKDGIKLEDRKVKLLVSKLGANQKQLTSVRSTGNPLEHSGTICDYRDELIASLQAQVKTLSDFNAYLQSKIKKSA